MSDRPRVIHVHVYEDYLPHFEDQGKVWRVTDHTPPADIDRGTTAWVDKALVDELIKTLESLVNHRVFAKWFPKHCRAIKEAIAAIQGEGK